MPTKLCVAVSTYASSGRWEHQQLSSGTDTTQSWEDGNVAEMSGTCLNFCVARVVGSFRYDICLCEGIERQSPVVDVLSTYNIVNMI